MELIVSGMFLLFFQPFLMMVLKEQKNIILLAGTGFKTGCSSLDVVTLQWKPALLLEIYQ